VIVSCLENLLHLSAFSTFTEVLAYDFVIKIKLHINQHSNIVLFSSLLAALANCGQTAGQTDIPFTALIVKVNILPWEFLPMALPWGCGLGLDLGLGVCSFGLGSCGLGLDMCGLVNITACIECRCCCCR